MSGGPLGTQTEEEELPSALRGGPAHGKQSWLGNLPASGRSTPLMQQASLHVSTGLYTQKVSAHPTVIYTGSPAPAKG